jgi:hypothetical protein
MCLGVASGQRQQAVRIDRRRVAPGSMLTVAPIRFGHEHGAVGDRAPRSSMAGRFGLSDSEWLRRTATVVISQALSATLIVSQLDSTFKRWNVECFPPMWSVIGGSHESNIAAPGRRHIESKTTPSLNPDVRYAWRSGNDFRLRSARWVPRLRPLLW